MPSMKGKTGTLHRPDLGRAFLENVGRQHQLAMLRQELRALDPAAALAIVQTTYNAPRVGAGQAFMEAQFPGLQGMELIADLVMPIFTSKVKAGKYPAITRESILATPDAKRGASGDYNRVDFESEDKDFTCEEFGLETRLGDDKRSLFASDFDAEMVSVEGVRGLLALAREIRAAGLMFNTSTWTGASLYTDYSSSGPWATAATDIIGQIVTARNASRALTGVDPDTLAIGPVNMANMIKNTGIRAAMGTNGVVTEATIRNNLAAVLGLRKLFVGRGVKNASKEGQAFSGSDVWAGYALVCKTADNPQNLAEPCVARTLLWGEDSPDNPVIEQYREEQRRSDIYRVRHNLDEVVIDASFGHLLKTVA